MAQLAILLAALLFLAVAVSAYKTTVTTFEIDDDENNTSWGRGLGRCTMKLQSANLSPCESYINEQRRGKEQDVIALRGIRTKGNGNLEECCDQLKEINDGKCQRRALRRIMQNQASELEGKEMSQFLHELHGLPEKCDIEVPSCELGGFEI